MSADEINKAIAESIGIVKENQWGKLYRTDREGWTVNCPNYHDSLDAIVPVVRALPDDEKADVINMIYISVVSPACLATPAQWCEAYLKSKGLWHE